VLAGPFAHQYHSVFHRQFETETDAMTTLCITIRRTVVSLALSLAFFSLNAAAEDPVNVLMKTSMGDISLELYPDAAPRSVENFLNYANGGFYDGTIFHRVISHFMIQGGGFTPDMQKKPTGDPIQNEANNGLSNKRGTIAMARTNDPHSATAQFFINVQDNMNLDYTGDSNSRAWGYAVFGKVTAGMEVVEDIRFVQTATRRPFSDVPVEAVVIEEVRVVE
jgi:cyclophilin family peptidyl-prolyl cis-trans isomerase